MDTIEHALFSLQFEKELKRVVKIEVEKLQEKGYQGTATLILFHEEGDPLMGEVQVQYQELRRVGGFLESYPGLGEELYEYLTSQSYPVGYTYNYSVELSVYKDEEVHEATRKRIVEEATYAH